VRPNPLVLAALLAPAAEAQGTPLPGGDVAVEFEIDEELRFDGLLVDEEKTVEQLKQSVTDSIVEHLSREVGFLRLRSYHPGEEGHTHKLHIRLEPENPNDRFDEIENTRFRIRLEDSEGDSLGDGVELIGFDPAESLSALRQAETRDVLIGLTKCFTEQFDYADAATRRLFAQIDVLNGPVPMGVSFYDGDWRIFAPFVIHDFQASDQADNPISFVLRTGDWEHVHVKMLKPSRFKKEVQKDGGTSSYQAHRNIGESYFDEAVLGDGVRYSQRVVCESYDGEMLVEDEELSELAAVVTDPAISVRAVLFESAFVTHYEKSTEFERRSIQDVIHDLDSSHFAPKP